eukprot:gene9483-8486_t
MVRVPAFDAAPHPWALIPDGCRHRRMMAGVRVFFASMLTAALLGAADAYACTVGPATCYADFTDGKRILGPIAGAGPRSHEACAQFCHNLRRNDTVAGVEDGSQCFCGRAVAPGAKTATGCRVGEPNPADPAKPAV